MDLVVELADHNGYPTLASTKVGLPPVVTTTVAPSLGMPVGKPGRTNGKRLSNPERTISNRDKKKSDHRCRRRTFNPSMLKVYSITITPLFISQVFSPIP
jgi:hypothetical protein